MSVCSNTDLYTNDIACTTQGWINDFIDKADRQVDSAKDAIDAMTAALTALLQNITYNPSPTTVMYSAPTPVSLPTPGAFLTSSEYDAIYNREADRLTEQSEAEADDVWNLAGSRGIGLWTPQLQTGLDTAYAKADQRLMEVVSNRAATEAQMSRDDKKTLWMLAVDNYKALLDGERTRLEYLKEQIRQILEIAGKGADVQNINYARAIDKVIGVQQAIAQLYAGMGQMYLAATNIGFHSQGQTSNTYQYSDSPG